MQKPVMLREKGKAGTAQPYEAAHAQRLLAYPGSVWEEVPAEKAPASADAKAAPAKTK